MATGGVSPVPREARSFQGHRAGLVTRMVAAVVDGAVVVLGLLVGYAALSGVLFLLDPRGFSFPELGLVVSLTTTSIVLVLYLAVSWRISGRSYGCLVMGLRVVGPRGRRLGLVSALARGLFCVLFPIGLLWVAVSRENRSVQDVLLRTSVVYDWQPGGASDSSVRPGR